MQVKTTSGYAEGYWKDGIYCFQGIPYAAAKRFMPPEKYQWEGVYNASRFGRKAIQSCPLSAENDRLTYSEEYGENCLSLDIYVPGEAPEKRKKRNCRWRCISTEALSRMEAAGIAVVLR